MRESVNRLRARYLPVSSRLNPSCRREVNENNKFGRFPPVVPMKLRRMKNELTARFLKVTDATTAKTTEQVKRQKTNGYKVIGKSASDNVRRDTVKP